MKVLLYCCRISFCMFSFSQIMHLWRYWLYSSTVLNSSSFTWSLSLQLTSPKFLFSLNQIRQMMHRSFAIHKSMCSITSQPLYWFESRQMHERWAFWALPAASAQFFSMTAIYFLAASGSLHQIRDSMKRHHKMLAMKESKQSTDECRRLWLDQRQYFRSGHCCCVYSAELCFEYFW